MNVIEHSAQRLVVQGGSKLNRCTLILDKSAGRARIEFATLMWRRMPLDVDLSEIDRVDLASSKDAASGAEIFRPVVHTRSGATAALPIEEKDDADVTVARVRRFLGLH